jgi:coenzyme F420-reducing hydrogenase delta subunit
MFNLSAAMATEFVRAATEMAETVRELGPSPLRKTPDARSEK